MSNERDIPKDPAVSATYRELATETTPDSLDKAVLREAALAAKKSGYAGIIGWTKPIAWAATIGLTLFITVQIADTPTPEIDAATEVLTPLNEQDEDSQLVETPRAELRADDAYANSGSDSDSDATARSREIDTSASSLMPTNSSARPSVADEFRPPDTKMLERAEALAELQAGSERGAEAQVDALQNAVEDGDDRARQSFAANVAEAETSADEIVVTGAPVAHPADEIQSVVVTSARVTKAPDATPNCSAEQRETLEEWRACIEELKAAGLEDAASEEWQQLIEQYPEVEKNESR